MKFAAKAVVGSKINKAQKEMGLENTEKEKKISKILRFVGFGLAGLGKVEN